MNNKESIFSKLEKDLNAGVSHERLFPDYFNPDIKKVKILFVAPRMDAYGYYQQILPALYFNRPSNPPDQTFEFASIFTHEDDQSPVTTLG